VAPHLLVGPATVIGQMARRVANNVTSTRSTAWLLPRRRS
jgi:hypothetical protein